MKYQSTTDMIACILHKLDNLHFYLLSVLESLFKRGNMLLELM